MGDVEDVLGKFIADQKPLGAEFEAVWDANAKKLYANERQPMTKDDAIKAIEGWQDISTAPRDGTDIQAEIPGNGSDNVIAWQVNAFLDDDEQPVGGWAFTTDQEPPDCWTDGICWATNEDGVASVQPTRWKPLPPEKA